ncbi:MAG: DUF2934 domain-containing protein [Candidatus Omnitrophota bacterium]
MMKKVLKKIKEKTAIKRAAAKIKTTAAKPKKTAKPVTAASGKNAARPAEFSAMIEKKAYEFYQSRGFAHGNDQGDWFAAEKAVLAQIKK